MCFVPLHVRVHIYFGDMGIVGDCDDEDALLHITDEVAGKIVGTVEGALGCKLAVKTGGIVSSSDSVMLKLQKRLQDLPNRMHSVLKVLDIDFAAGKARKAIKLVTRAWRNRQAERRNRKVSILAKAAGAAAAKVQRTGVQAMTKHGSTVWGYTDAELLRARRGAAKGRSPKARGRSLDMLDAIQGAPVAAQHVSCIVQWSKEVWIVVCGRSREAHGLTVKPELKASLYMLMPSLILLTISGTVSK